MARGRQSRDRWFVAFLMVALALLLVGAARLRNGAGASTAAPSAVVAGAGTVVHVIDGDTIVVDIEGVEEHVRLIGIDTPETKKPDHPVECFGPEASARLGELLPPGTAVRLERDAEARDQYGRLLAYVFRLGDDQFVEEVMLREGMGAVLDIAPNSAYRSRLGEAAADAKSARRGLWAACGGPHDAAPRRSDRAPPIGG